jgi:hypothetical protein
LEGVLSLNIMTDAVVHPHRCQKRPHQHTWNGWTHSQQRACCAQSNAYATHLVTFIVTRVQRFCSYNKYDINVSAYSSTDD